MKNDTKVSAARQKKETIVAKLSEKIKKAKALVFANYQGLTHIQLEQLKKNLKQTEAELIITKNTLLKRALSNSQFSTLNSQFQDPTATLFAYQDLIAPLKELAKTIKQLKLPTIKFGIFEGKLLAEGDILRLSILPSREVLLAQVAGSMKAPIFGLQRALNWNLQKLMMTLKAIESKKASSFN